MVRSIPRGDPDYPSSLYTLKTADVEPPEKVSVEGNYTYDPRRLHLAIVGSRDCHRIAYDFAKLFAEYAARAGAIVLSGGAKGIDRAAHEGAMKGGGVTWAVLGCGYPHLHPQANADLFPQIVESDGVIVRPFPDGEKPARHRFLHRNRILAALANVVLVVQASKPSGALSTASWSLKLGRSLWVVPCALAHKNIKGTALLMKDERVNLVRSMVELGEAVGVYVPDPDEVCVPVLGADPDPEADSESDLIDDSEPNSEPVVELSTNEKTVLAALSLAPKHPDQLAIETGLSASAVSTALLTLALGDVVVEGSSGLFHRKKFVTH